MFRRIKRQFLDLPLAQKFVGIFVVLTLLSGALMIGALHLGLSVFEEKFYEKSLQELDFFVQRVDDDIQDIDTLTRSIAVDSNIQEQLNALAQADPQTANYYYLLTGVRPLLLEKIYQDRQINSLQYTDLNGHTLTIGQDMPDPGAGRQTALEMALNATPGGFVIQTSDSADFPYILCGRRILRSQDMSLKKLGTIVVALDVGKLLDNEIHSLSSQPSELYLYNGHAAHLPQRRRGGGSSAAGGEHPRLPDQHHRGQKILHLLADKFRDRAAVVQRIRLPRNLWPDQHRPQRPDFWRVCHPVIVCVGTVTHGTSGHKAYPYPERSHADRGSAGGQFCRRPRPAARRPGSG